VRLRRRQTGRQTRQNGTPDARSAEASATKPGFSKVYAIGVDPAFGFKRVLVELSVPSLPSLAGRVEFAEHEWSNAEGGSTRQVIALARGVIAVSEDLGETWEAFRPDGTDDVRLWNAFTTSDGTHLIQGAAPPSGEPIARSGGAVPLFAFDRSWKLRHRLQPGTSPWHGARSIDEANGVIMYGEYPENALKYQREGRNELDDCARLEREGLLLPSRVLRSRDQGAHWETVLELSWRDVRHFHTVAADPYRAGRWWASTGDRVAECQVWETLDGGDSWAEVGSDELDVTLHPAGKKGERAVFRYTDLVVRRDDVLWGADDWLGNVTMFYDQDVTVGRRVGSRIFRSPRETPWRPEAVGFVGHPVRSIVDVGGAYVITTEAKQAAVGLCPQVLLMSAEDPTLIRPLFNIDNFAAQGTGLTYSKASRAARDGVFFSYRQAHDAFDGGPRILRWRVAFD
jgi:hypothetical protein